MPRLFRCIGHETIDYCEDSKLNFYIVIFKILCIFTRPATGLSNVF